MTQLEIPMTPQPKGREPNAKTYDAILRLRAAGFAVRREGAHHRVRQRLAFDRTGRLLTTPELLRMEWEIGKMRRTSGQAR